MPFTLESLKAKKQVVVKKVTQTVKVDAGPASTTPRSYSTNQRPSAASRFSNSQTKARKQYPTPPAERHAAASRGVKRPASRTTTKSPSVVAFDSDSEDDESMNSIAAATSAKRARTDPLADLPTRNVRSRQAFDEGGDDRPAGSFIHGEEMPAREKKAKFQPSFAGLQAGAMVELQYPSVSEKERFQLVKPVTAGDTSFNAIDDIHATMKMVIKYYLPESEQDVLDDEIKGFPARLSRAVYKQNEDDLRRVIDEWNGMLITRRKDGTIAETLDKLGRVSKELVERILNQAHARTVSPEDGELHRYEAGSNEVYGELLPRFVSKILLEDTGLSQDQVFVDLGSGVGNVVLQAALEVGCESWGCEIKPEYCRLADAQKEEFEARCQLWGLSHGAIHLERGDFCENEKIKAALQRADVIVVNNEVFSPLLNERLTTLFLDLKPGCRIVSLKSFVPAGHKITARNVNSPVNLLRVDRKTYYSDCVSWKNDQGNYYISTKDSSMLERFASRAG